MFPQVNSSSVAPPAAKSTIGSGEWGSNRLCIQALLGTCANLDALYGFLGVPSQTDICRCLESISRNPDTLKTTKLHEGR
ncbi:uncharacterized [Tachysurus ichikawai]